MPLAIFLGSFSSLFRLPLKHAIGMVTALRFSLGPSSLFCPGSSSRPVLLDLLGRAPRQPGDPIGMRLTGPEIPIVGTSLTLLALGTVARATSITKQVI